MTPSTELKWGLSSRSIAAIQAVFQRYPAVETAVLYGSRAKGTYRPGSDIDLTLTGPLTYAQLLEIELELDDLLLPYKIDLSLFHLLDQPDLLAHLARVGQVFYQKSAVKLSVTQQDSV